VGVAKRTKGEEKKKEREGEGGERVKRGKEGGRKEGRGRNVQTLRQGEGEKKTTSLGAKRE